MPIHIEVVTQEERIFEEPLADSVTIPATEGLMTVLPRHAPVLTTLSFGELIVRKGNAEESFAIYGGVVDVRPDKIVVLADLAESSFAIDLEAMESARASAEKLLEEGVPEEENRQATLALRRAELAIRIRNRIHQRGSVLRILDDEDTEGEE
jgi:F-type H+-transporting ATPase subunit epsilon